MLFLFLCFFTSSLKLTWRPIVVLHFKRFIRTRGFRAAPWASWTPSWMTCLRGSPQRRPGWLSTISAPPSPAERCRPRWGCCCPGSWRSTPCQREPRPSPSTPVPNEDFTLDAVATRGSEVLSAGFNKYKSRKTKLYLYPRFLHGSNAYSPLDGAIAHLDSVFWFNRPHFVHYSYKCSH